MAKSGRWKRGSRVVANDKWMLKLLFVAGWVLYTSSKIGYAEHRERIHVSRCLADAWVDFNSPCIFNIGDPASWTNPRSREATDTLGAERWLRFQKIQFFWGLNSGSFSSRSCLRTACMSSYNWPICWSVLNVKVVALRRAL